MPQLSHSPAESSRFTPLKTPFTPRELEGSRSATLKLSRFDSSRCLERLHGVGGATGDVATEGDVLAAGERVHQGLHSDRVDRPVSRDPFPLIVGPADQALFVIGKES